MCTPRSRCVTHGSACAPAPVQPSSERRVWGTLPGHSCAREPLGLAPPCHSPGTARPCCDCPPPRSTAAPVTRAFHFRGEEGAPVRAQVTRIREPRHPALAELVPISQGVPASRRAGFARALTPRRPRCTRNTFEFFEFWNCSSEPREDPPQAPPGWGTPVTQAQGRGTRDCWWDRSHPEKSMRRAPTVPIVVSAMDHQGSRAPGRGRAAPQCDRPQGLGRPLCWVCKGGRLP